MIYCIEVERECEDMAVLHKNFDQEPTKAEVISYLNDEENMNYDDDYGRVRFYEVSGDIITTNEWGITIKYDPFVQWAKDHYWDSLEKDKDLIIKHIEGRFDRKGKATK